jgi:hypothetical protein
MIEGALVLPPGTCGMIEASATRGPATPWTRRRGSTPDLVTIRAVWAVPDIGHAVFQLAPRLRDEEFERQPRRVEVAIGGNPAVRYGAPPVAAVPHSTLFGNPGSREARVRLMRVGRRAGAHPQAVANTAPASPACRRKKRHESRCFGRCFD